MATIVYIQIPNLSTIDKFMHLGLQTMIHIGKCRRMNDDWIEGSIISWDYFSNLQLVMNMPVTDDVDKHCCPLEPDTNCQCIQRCILQSSIAMSIVVIL